MSTSYLQCQPLSEMAVLRYGSIWSHGDIVLPYSNLLSRYGHGYQTIMKSTSIFFLFKYGCGKDITHINNVDICLRTMLTSDSSHHLFLTDFYLMVATTEYS